MFKNREVRIRLARTNDSDPTSPVQLPTLDAQQIEKIATSIVKTTITSVGGVLIVKTLLATACAIAVHTATVKIK